MNDIAIIGMAGRFPEAGDMETFYRNLRSGRNSVREVSEERIGDTAISPHVDYLPYAYLDGVDRFDAAFFNISQHEAMNMDPHQRILLEVACQALESSAQPLSYFSNTRTAVILSDYTSVYYEMAADFDPTLVPGTLSAFAAGRIARQFNLRGMATMVNTTCSSSLVALHMACRQLINGEADMALTGGISVCLKPTERSPEYDIGVVSPDGNTRAFSDDANGTGLGEGAACVLLVKLDRALREGFPIHAVIKGTSVNQDAQLSASLTAPSSKAQAQVLKEAWTQAGIDPSTITYIEAHGTATKLGDPVEISGIEMAFREFTDRKQFCAISSVKSNIGHTGNIAGMMSLCKAVLSLRKKELLPSINFRKPNPFIRFARSPVYINSALKSWTAEGHPLRAGVSSFGLMGTNSHVILEEAPVMDPRVEYQGVFLFSLSARSVTALENNRKALVDFLDGNAVPIQDISYTLATGREHYPYRKALIASSIEELRRGLLQPAHESAAGAGEKMRIVFIFSGGDLADPAVLHKLSAMHPLVAAGVEECLKVSGEREVNASTAGFIAQYALYKAITGMGIHTENLLGTGTGELVVDVLTGEISLQSALKGDGGAAAADMTDFDSRMLNLYEREMRQGDSLFAEMGLPGCLSEGLRRVSGSKQGEKCRVLTLTALTAEGFLQWLKEWYLLGYGLRWEGLYSDMPVRKAILPVYSFDEVRCWLREKGDWGWHKKRTVENGSPVTASAGVTDPAPAGVTNPALAGVTIAAPACVNFVQGDSSWTETEKKVAAIWMEVLRLPAVKKDDDFFGLGGHSLLGARVISRIERDFGIRLSFREVFTFSTVRSLSEGIDRLVKDRRFAAGLPPLVPVIPGEHYALSHAQRRLWVLDNMEEGQLLSYNAPYTILLEGSLNEEAFRKAFDGLIDRHEILRTSFILVDGEPRQRVHENTGFELPVKDLSGEEDTDMALQQFVAKEISKVFDLSTGPLLKATLLRTGPDRHVLLFIMHHIISDGWSMAVVMKEISYLYDVFDKGLREFPPPLAIQYKDYSVWHNQMLDSEVVQPAKAWWHQKLAGPLPESGIPADHRRPSIQTYSGDTYKFRIPATHVQPLKRLATEQEGSLFMSLLAVVNILLSRYSGSGDVIIGSPVAGRIHPELENSIGFFVNTLALRNTVDEQERFYDFFQRVRQNSLDALEHQLYPFDKLVEELVTIKDRQRNPVFDVMMVLQNNTMEPVRLGELVLSPLQLDFKVSLFDVMISFWETGEDLDVEINYNTDLYEQSTIVLLAHHMQSLMENAGRAPHEAIKMLEMKSPLERRSIQNATNISFDF